MKGIILAGGSGTRLFPCTQSISKQLLPVYDKPMIYYPLSTLMLAGIKDIQLIVKSSDIEQFQSLLKDGSHLGINISYAIQDQPNGIAESLIIGEQFIGKDNIALILGDNIFFGESFQDKLRTAIKELTGGTIFLNEVRDPERFGVATIDKNGYVSEIIEKPQTPISRLAVTGLYFYMNDAINLAKELKPSQRNELEITDLNNMFIDQNRLNAVILERGFAWLDTGTHDALIDAGMFVKTVQTTQDILIGSIEEIAFKNGWIDKEALQKSAQLNSKSNYGRSLLSILDSI